MKDEEKTYFLKCSYFEIYNDQIYDLLKPRGNIGDPLSLMEDAKRDHFMIKGLTEHSVTSIKEIFDKLKKGEVNRHYAATFMNHSSSRSHTLFRITVKAVTNNFIRNYRKENKGQSNLNLHHFLNPDEDNENHGTVVTESYLNFVDLAGSERIGSHLKTNEEEEIEEDEKEKVKASKDNRVKEGKAINKSLFFLTRVISLLAEGKQNIHIPFRNSPLTKILRSSLGGNFRTLVVLCVNPCQSQIEISLSTMRFGVNAKKIQNAIKANILTNNNDESIKILIEQYERKMRDLQNQRDEDLNKYMQYVNVIDELRLQRSLLLERIEDANKKLSVHLANSIPENELFKFFRQAQTKIAVMPQTGILFIPKSQNKYDDLQDLEGETDKATRFKKKFEEEMRCTASDFVNKFALQAYNKVKTDFEGIKKKVSDHQNYLTQLCQSFKTVCEFVANLSALGEAYLHKLQTMSEQYEDEYILANERQLKLDLYEKFKGFTLLSDNDLDKMKNYLLDFRETVKSELDRRELLASKPGSLPQDALDALQELYTNEKENQEHKLLTIRTKIESFVTFREGCKAETDYYSQLNRDFRSKTDLDTKAKEIEDFISTQMVDIASKVQKMEGKFTDLDSQLKTAEKQTIDKTYKDMKNKFDKLIDMVLLQGKSPKPKEEKVEEQTSKESPEVSVAGSPSKQSMFRRSRTINMDDDQKSVKGAEVKTGANESKVKAWMTLNKMENYGSMIKDDESVMRSIYGGLAAYMTGNNLAIINENVSNDDNMSDRTFSMKPDKTDGGLMNQKSCNGKPFTTKELSNRMIPERLSYAGGPTGPAPGRRDRMKERKSHVVGRSDMNPFALEIKNLNLKEKLPLDKGNSSTKNNKGQTEEREKAVSLINSPRTGKTTFSNHPELMNGQDYSSEGSDLDLDENSKRKGFRNMSSSKNLDSQSVDKSSPRARANPGLKLDLKKSQPIVPALDYLSPNSLLTKDPKSNEFSHRVFGNIDKERISYKSQHNGHDSGAEDLMGEDAISVEHMEVKMNSHQNNKASRPMTKSSLSKTNLKEVTSSPGPKKALVGHKKEDSHFSSPIEHFCSESDLGQVKNFDVDINHQPFDDKKSSITSTPAKQPSKSTTANGKKATPSTGAISTKKNTREPVKVQSGSFANNSDLERRTTLDKKAMPLAKTSKNDKASEKPNEKKTGPNSQTSPSQSKQMSPGENEASNQKDKGSKTGSQSKPFKKEEEPVVTKEKPSKPSGSKQDKNTSEEVKKVKPEPKPEQISQIKSPNTETKKTGRPVTASAPKQGNLSSTPATPAKEQLRPLSHAKSKKDTSSAFNSASITQEIPPKSEDKPRTTASSLSKSFARSTEPSSLFKSSPGSKGTRPDTKK